MTTFRYKVGDKVLDLWTGDSAVVDQRRIEHGRVYYRLDSGVIRHESQLL